MAEEMQSAGELEIIHRLFRCKTLPEILDTGRPLVGNPIMLTDLTHRILAVTDEPDLRDTEWESACANGGIPLGHTDIEGINRSYRQSLIEGRPILDCPPDGGIPTLRRALSSDGKIIGYLNSPRYNNDFSEENIGVFDFISDLCCLRMQKNLNYADTPENLLEFFISDLMEGRLTDEHLIAERFRFFHWNVKWPLQIISARYCDGDTAKLPFAIENIIGKLSASLSLPTIFRYGQDIKILVPVSEISDRESDFYAELKAILKEESLSAGVSRVFYNNVDFAEFNGQAVKALQLGMLLHPEAFLYLYEDYVIYHTLEMCAGHIDLMKLCHMSVITLAEYDRDHDTALLESLRIYLSCNQNIGEAASRLFIHRNTMNYRISKIHDLLGLDLSDTDIAFHILYSYHVLEYYSATVMLDREEQRKRDPFKKRKD